MATHHVMLVNCALTTSMTTKFLEQINSSVGGGNKVTIFVAISGFPNSCFNKTPLSKQIENFKDMPSNLRFRFDKKQTYNKQQCKDGQQEITDATFEFFHKLSVLQEEHEGLIDIVFTSLTRSSRPMTMIFRTEDGFQNSQCATKKDIDANNNFIAKAIQPIQAIQQQTTDLHKLALEKKFQKFVLEAQMILNGCLGIQTFLEEFQDKFNLSVEQAKSLTEKIDGKQSRLTDPVFNANFLSDPQDETNSTFDSNNRITYLADLMGLLTAHLFFERKEDFFSTKSTSYQN